MATKFGHSRAVTGKKSKYKPKTNRDDKYEAFWGTPGSQASLRSWSLRNVRHPLVVWADQGRDLARRHGTPDEYDAATAVWMDIKECTMDFKGSKSWSIRIAEARLDLCASIVRL